MKSNHGKYKSLKDALKESGMWEDDMVKHAMDGEPLPGEMGQTPQVSEPPRVDINTSIGSDGHKSITVNAAGESADNLIRLLQLAGLAKQAASSGGMGAIGHDDFEEELLLPPKHQHDHKSSGDQDCGCNSWDCKTCFPDQDGHLTPASDSDVCTKCGHEVDSDIHEMQCGLEEEYQNSHGEESPLTYGEKNLGEEELEEVSPPGMKDTVKDLIKQYDGDEEKAYGTAWKIYYQKHGKKDESVSEEELNEVTPPGMEDKMADLKAEYPGEPEKAYATAWAIYNKTHGKKESIEEDTDSEEREDMINSINTIQNLGFSQSDKKYDEAQLKSMPMDQLTSVYSEVTGKEVDATPEVDDTTDVDVEQGQEHDKEKQQADEEVLEWIQRFKKVDNR